MGADSGLIDCRVLVVEDEYALAEDIRRELVEAGAVVVGPVPTIGKAMRLVQSEPRLDCAVLDINLGGEMVFPLAEALRARSIPFLFATGYDSGRTPEAYKDIPCLEKPVPPGEAARQLRLLLQPTGVRGANGG